MGKRKHFITLITLFASVCFLLSAIPSFARDATFTWTANPEPVEGYTIYYNTGTSGPPYANSIDVGNVTTYTVTNLDDNTTYYFTITAYIGTDESPYAPEVILEPVTTIAPPAEPPVALDSSISTLEDQTITGTVTATNSSGLPITYQLQALPSLGTVTLDGTSGSYTYTPNPNVNGNDTFTFVATDDNGTSNAASVAITITPANDPPTAEDVTLSGPEDTALAGNLLAADIDSTTLTYTLQSNAQHGLAVITDSASGSFVYTPNPDFFGTDSFTWSVSDGSSSSNTATVSITITPTNDQPTAYDVSLSTISNTPVNGQLQASDPEKDPLTYTIVSNGSLGTATITDQNTGAFTYTPNQNASGTDSFTFAVSDGITTSNTATVSVTIATTNTPPVANNGTMNGTRGQSVTGFLTAEDADNDTLTYTIVSDPLSAVTLTNPATGEFTILLSDSMDASYSFTFKANDGIQDSNTATMTVSIAEPTSDTVTFIWSLNPEPVAGYKLYYKTGDSGPPYDGTGLPEGNSPIDVGNVTRFTISGLDPQLTYRFTITAYTSDGQEGEYTGEIIIGNKLVAPQINNIIEIK
ncbi:hypothetical protein GF1_00730 [Desulfolithobacter dissulfuricans]|uniref:Fibronectin type-III domain-containing protein n=1 Tax=Desulfolithobacter dissulfuricans TaxID=2795293 RepID=A0A915TZN4_9BACT|nr:Ig-like domain-containing protein [Desulfolithobacter dissulfuricans]BCO07697.1 hypothetical protein GF1_00730 [Desulfolithobacter dissulfuricans]